MEVSYQRHTVLVYCGMPGSPCLSKTGLISARIFLIFNNLSICIRLVKALHKSCACATQQVGGSLSVLGLVHPSCPGAKAVLRRPRLAGTRQYIAQFPTVLARYCSFTNKCKKWITCSNINKFWKHSFPPIFYLSAKGILDNVSLLSLRDDP